MRTACTLYTQHFGKIVMLGKFETNLKVCAQVTKSIFTTNVYLVKN